MKVLVDDIWCSSSNLHLRVTVGADDWKWRKKFYEVVPLETIPEEAMVYLLAYFMDHAEVEVNPDTPLFE